MAITEERRVNTAVERTLRREASSRRIAAGCEKMVGAMAPPVCALPNIIASAMRDGAHTAQRTGRSMKSQPESACTQSVPVPGLACTFPGIDAVYEAAPLTTKDPPMTNGKSAANRVLASIPPGEYERLRSQLEPVTVDFGQVLYEPGQAIQHVYFPVDCLISLLTAVDKRRSLEVGMVGNEGMAGMPFILGMGVSGVRALVQGGGNALRMASAPFRIEFDRNRALQDALYRYTYALMAQISQTAACNRFHEAEARLSRWLLMTRDRVESDEFPLTHEFLAHMLGVRREGVTEAASALKRRKLIAYSRGNIQILDVRGLKASACSCYQIVKTVYDRAQV